MSRCFPVILGLLAALVPSSLAQTTPPTTQPGLTDRTPQENVSGEALAQRRPGTWVNRALQRHNELIKERVTDRLSGEAQQQAAEASRSGSSSAGAGTSLTDLLSSLGSLGSLLSGTSLGTGTSLGSGTTTTGGTTTATGGGTTGASGSSDGMAGFDPSGTETLEDYIRRRAEEEREKQGATQASNNPYALGGAIARLPKRDFDTRSQSLTDLLSLAGGGSTQQAQTTELPFRTRWSNAMLQAFFTALDFGFRTSDFVKILADAIRPILRPETANGGTGGNGDGSGGSGNGSGSGGSGNGGASGGGGSGIEDTPPPTGGSGGGSTI